MKKISRNSVEDTKKLSRDSDRRRKIKNFHESEGEKIQRMANVVQPDSYIRPHRHFKSPEVFLALWGKAVMFEFDEKGNVTESTVIKPGSETAGVEFEPGKFHSLIALEPDTVLYEA
ncbi:MAG: WbuC family cupin fold metalloprotein [Candidatus Undinarchaeales archaeon]